MEVFLDWRAAPLAINIFVLFIFGFLFWIHLEDFSKSASEAAALLAVMLGVGLLFLAAITLMHASIVIFALTS